MRIFPKGCLGWLFFLPALAVLTFLVWLQLPEWLAALGIEAFSDERSESNAALIRVGPSILIAFVILTVGLWIKILTSNVAKILFLVGLAVLLWEPLKQLIATIRS